MIVREIDDEEAEAKIREGCREMDLSYRQVEEVLKDHRRVGRMFLVNNIEQSLKLFERMAAKKHEPWDDAARQIATRFGYTSHIHVLVNLRRDIEARNPGGMDRIVHVETTTRIEDGVEIQQEHFRFELLPGEGGIGGEGPFSAN